MTLNPAHPALVVSVAALAVVVRLLEVPAPGRGAVIGVFLLVGPGAALVGDPPGWPRLVWWTAVLAASVAMSILVSSALLYAGVWTPDRVLAVLTLGVGAGCGIRVLATRRAEP